LLAVTPEDVGPLSIDVDLKEWIFF